MYTDGFGFAVFVAVAAVLLPALWIGWWLLADFGEKANRAYPTGRRGGSEIPVNGREEQTAEVRTPFATA